MEKLDPKAEGAGRDIHPSVRLSNDPNGKDKIMTRPVYHYARNYTKPFLGREADKSSKTLEILTLLDNYFPREEGTTLGIPFTFKEIRGLFYASYVAAEGQKFLEEAPNPRTFKARFLYLWETGLLARTKEGWEHWEIMKNGYPLEVTTEGTKARNIPLPNEPATMGMTDDELMQRIEEVTKEKPAIPSIDDPDFFKNLLKGKD